ncbi:mechanosensitive ion channel family protein [Psychroserpens damuponensis]|uniref:mechanosensitive ion channel family protein n=1 Tax=Psychroserpens damuponensis TaxID=943936 RepID=UPI00058BA92A|nr:mechanosensitive ion channel family protein [Psychroserpens damuponensis]
MNDQLNTAFGNLKDKLFGWFNAIIANLPNLVLAILVFVAAFFIARYVSKLVEKLVSRRVEQKSISLVVSRIASVITVLVGLFLALGILNLSQALTSLLAGAGVIGLVVGLALQGTLSNTVSGIVLSFRNRIRIGNWVETNGYSGEVMDINLNTFILKESDNNIVVVPNKMILENPIKNYSLTTRMRVTLECGVGYESDLEAVEQLTKETIATHFKQVEKSEDVEFYYTEFGDSSINYLCRFWIDAESMLEKLRAKTKAIIEIKKAYDKAGINIPFPIRTLQFDSKLSINTPENSESTFSNN